MNKILVVEPYFGGSHKQFLEDLEKYIEAEFKFLTLPARKWKMRMQLSAPWFAKCIEGLPDRDFDTMLCSTFVDVAVLKALSAKIDGWREDCRVCTYYHENQFVYPNQVNDASQHQFTAINFSTALASDKIAFNSRFNYESFLDHSSRYVKKASDMYIGEIIDEVKRKSTVIYPGLDFKLFKDRKKKKNKVPIICWNHRWEHDKNPEEFFETLYKLKDNLFDFKIIILGQSFRSSPDIFEQAKLRLRDRIVHFGYVESREKYVDLLFKSDIVVSTAVHEFFGMSVIEAVRAGCIPVVPDRLSYPELYPRECRYSDGHLFDHLSATLRRVGRFDTVRLSENVERFEWSALADSYCKWLLK